MNPRPARYDLGGEQLRQVREARGDGRRERADAGSGGGHGVSGRSRDDGGGRGRRFTGRAPGDDEVERAVRHVDHADVRVLGRADPALGHDRRGSAISRARRPGSRQVPTSRACAASVSVSAPAGGSAARSASLTSAGRERRMNAAACRCLQDVTGRPAGTTTPSPRSVSAGSLSSRGRKPKSVAARSTTWATSSIDSRSHLRVLRRGGMSCAGATRIVRRGARGDNQTFGRSLALPHTPAISRQFPPGDAAGAHLAWRCAPSAFTALATRRLPSIPPSPRTRPSAANHGGVGQRGGVAERAAFGDVLQQAAHDFAGAGLGQVGRRRGCRRGGRWRRSSSRRGPSAPSSSSSVGSWPSLSVTKAAMRLALHLVRLPTTAASATAGWSTSALSTSIVPMRWPATFSTSSMRPRSQK